MQLTPDLFSNYGRMNTSFLNWLQVVIDGASWFTKITSDYREPKEQAALVGTSGGAVKSLHELGQAVDLRMPTNNGVIDETKLGILTDSISLFRRGNKVELEIDITPNDLHIHIGWYGYVGPLILRPKCRHTTGA